MTPAMMSSEPRQSTRPVHTATARPITGDITDDRRRAASQAVIVLDVALRSCCSWWSSRPNACTTCIVCSPSLTAPLTALLTRRTKIARNGTTASAMSVKSHRHSNITTTIPTTVSVFVMIVEGGHRRETLDRLDVAGEGAEYRSDPIGVVVGERKLLVKAQAQIVSDLLTQPFGQVVAGIHRRSSRRGDEHCRDSRGCRDMRLAAQRRQNGVDPGELVMCSDDAVDDDLQRPWRGQTYRYLHQHRGQNQCQGHAVRAEDFAKNWRHG